MTFLFNFLRSLHVKKLRRFAITFRRSVSFFSLHSAMLAKHSLTSRTFSMSFIHLRGKKPKKIHKIPKFSTKIKQKPKLGPRHPKSTPSKPEPQKIFYKAPKIIVEGVLLDFTCEKMIGPSS